MKYRIVGSVLLGTLLAQATIAQEGEQKDESVANEITKVREAISTNVEQKKSMRSFHFIVLKYASAKEIETALSKLFDDYTRSGDLIIVSDARTNRIGIRSTDEIYNEVRLLVDEIDVDSANTPVPNVSPETFENRESNSESNALRVRLSNGDIVRDYLRLATNPKSEEDVWRELASKVEQEFVEKQMHLLEELKKLRSKIDDLESLLTQRETMKEQICNERIRLLLLQSSSLGNELQGQMNGVSSTKNPLSTDPSFIALTIGSSLASRPLAEPILKSNANLSKDIFERQKASIVIQATLMGEEGIQPDFPDSDSAPALGFGLHLQVTDQLGYHQVKLKDVKGTRATATFKIVCQDATDDFWRRIKDQKILFKVTKSDMEQVANNNMVSKIASFSMKGSSRADVIEYFDANRLEPGVDPLDEARKIGQPVLSMVLSPSVDER